MKIFQVPIREKSGLFFYIKHRTAGLVIYSNMNDISIITQDVEYIEIENTKLKVTSYYNGNISFVEIIKNALKRDAEGFLSQLDNS